MAANRNGRVIYLDAPGTYTTLYDSKEFVRVQDIIIASPTGTGAGSASLTIYSEPTASVAAKIIFLGTAIASAAVVGFPVTVQFSLTQEADQPPDSFTGLSAILAGAAGTGGVGAQAWIYVM